MEKLYEIINRGVDGVQVLNQDEMEYVIEKYIYIRKGKSSYQSHTFPLHNQRKFRS